MLRELGLPVKGTKYDKIQSIIKSGNYDNFIKVFPKVYGKSGGLLRLFCRHGIVVYLKFLVRAESPVDYAEALINMKFPPTLFVCDFIRQVVASTNKRAPGLFNPFNGYWTEPTNKKVITDLENGQKMSIPYLTDGFVTELTKLVEGQHPVNGVSDVYGAADRLHHKNHTGEMKVLSDPDCVAELKTSSTEYAESMNCALKMVKKHASQCRSDRHLKLILFITLRYNLRRNVKLVKDRERVTGFKFQLHKEFGWIVPIDSVLKFPTFISKDYFVVGD